ncbi:hypothetical protein [Parafrankia sp. FMc2]|uniref:hypothetical protein n=1 Tax=Parafrankia sp. FMc2 TaxID=3233196 RepID=UPI0034D68504
MFTEDSPAQEPMRPRRRARRMRRLSPAARPRTVTYRAPVVLSTADAEWVLALTAAGATRLPLEA